MTPQALRRLAFDFRAARALFAGVELGVFESLGAGASSADELAGSLRLDPRGARILLDALAAIGALERRGESYALPDELRGALVPGGADYAGNVLLHDLWHWTSWARLDAALRDGKPVACREGDPHLENPDVLRRFLPNYALAMEQTEGGAAEKLAERVAALAPRRVLDLGGGSGGFVIALLERLPEATATLVDRAWTLPRAGERAALSPTVSRLEARALDFERDPLPGGHDAVVLSRVLMGLPPERARSLVQRAAAALAPGGVLVVHDYDAQSRVGALLALDMLLHTGGEAPPRAQLEAWLASAGLALVDARRLLPHTRAWIARKEAP